MTRVSHRKSSVALYFATLAYVGILVSSIGPTLPALAEKTGETLGVMSLIFTVRGLGFLLGTFLYGHFIDRCPGHRVMLVAAALTGSVVASVSAASSFAPLIALMLAFGIVESGLDTGANTLLTWTCGPKVAPFMNALHFFFGLGALAGPLLVVSFFSSGLSVSTVYLSLGAFGLLLLPGLLFVPSPKIPPRPVSSAADASQKKSLFLHLFIAFFLYVGLEVAFSGWLYTIALKHAGRTPQESGGINSLFWAVFTSGRLLAILMVRKVSVRILLHSALVGILLVTLAAWMFPLHGAALTALAFGMGAFMSATFPLLMSLASQATPLSGKGTSVLMLASGLGSMILPTLFGWALENWGFALGWTVIAVDAAFSLLACTTLVERVFRADDGKYS